MENKKQESKFFDETVTDRERAIFEGAVSLGAVFHQYIGAPFRKKERIENAIKESALTQPYVVDAEIHLNTPPKSDENTFEYDVVSGKILEIQITAEFGDARAILALDWIPEMDYPLMYIKEIVEEINRS